MWSFRARRCTLILQIYAEGVIARRCTLILQINAEGVIARGCTLILQIDAEGVIARGYTRIRQINAEGFYNITLRKSVKFVCICVQKSHFKRLHSSQFTVHTSTCAFFST